MNLSDIFNVFELSNKIKNQHYFNRYKKLISHYYIKKLIKQDKGEFEQHHILPVKMYPTYKAHQSNLVLLPAKAHYIAHYLLFKSISDRSCVFAFNQMRRITKSNRPTCKLYASVRIEFAKLISSNNKGRLKTNKQILATSIANKNTNTYRSPAGELKRFIIGSEPIGWIPFQTGRVKSIESKDKLGNKMINRIWQYHPTTKEVKFEKNLLNGFVVGFPPWFKASGKLAASTAWIHNPVTGVNKRLKEHNPMPIGFVFGRHFENVGFNKINNTGLVRVLDLVDKKFCLMEKENLDKTRYVVHGGSIDSIYLYKYNNITYTSLKDLFDNNKQLPPTNGGDMLVYKTIPIPHHNMSAERKEFCKIYHGQTFSDIGVNVIPLCKYVYNQKEIHVRHK